MKSYLATVRSTLHKRWFERIVAGYPADAARFFKREKNPFANPVGQTLAQETRCLLDAILDGDDAAALTPPLDAILRVRAVQDFSPAQMLAFVFELKPVLREDAEQDAATPVDGGWALGPEDLTELEGRVDRVALLGFDLLSRHRERIYQLKVDEVKRKVATILRRSPLWNGDDLCAPVATGSEQGTDPD